MHYMSLPTNSSKICHIIFSKEWLTDWQTDKKTINILIKNFMISIWAYNIEFVHIIGMNHSSVLIELYSIIFNEEWLTDF